MTEFAFSHELLEMRYLISSRVVPVAGVFREGKESMRQVVVSYHLDQGYEVSNAGAAC